MFQIPNGPIFNGIDASRGAYNLLGGSFFGRDFRASRAAEKLAEARIFSELLRRIAVSSRTMTTKQTVSVLVAAIGLAALPGCVVPPRPVAPQDSTKFSVENTDKFVPLDAASQAWVECTGLMERTLADGRLEVLANVKNRVRGQVMVEAQCVFQDDQAPLAPNLAPWRILTLPEDSTETVRFVAPGPQMKKYSIRVRQLR